MYFIHTYTPDVFPVVANMHAKSVQKQVKSIDVDKKGSKKPLASIFILFCVELIAFSFLDVISIKQARLNATISAFLLII